MRWNIGKLAAASTACCLERQTWRGIWARTWTERVLNRDESGRKAGDGLQLHAQASAAAPRHLSLLASASLRCFGIHRSDLSCL